MIPIVFVFLLSPTRSWRPMDWSQYRWSRKRSCLKPNNTLMFDLDRTIDPGINGNTAACRSQWLERGGHRRTLESISLHIWTSSLVSTLQGLALINGTQMITSLGAEAVERAQAIARQADIIAALTLEVLKGTTKAFDSGEQLQQRRPDAKLQWSFFFKTRTDKPNCFFCFFGGVGVLLLQTSTCCVHTLDR